MGCDIAADVQAIMGLLMQCAKGWGRGMAGVATAGNGRWGGGISEWEVKQMDIWFRDISSKFGGGGDEACGGG